MKLNQWIPLIALCSLLFFGITKSYTEQSGTRSTTLQQTLQWLTRATLEEGRPGRNIQVFFSSGGKDGCDVTIKEHQDAALGFPEHMVMTLSFSLADLDPNGVKVFSDEVRFHTTNALFKIRRFDYQMNIGEISLNREFAPKFADAFKHAVELCGGNKSLPGREEYPDIIQEFDISSSTASPDQAQWKDDLHSIVAQFPYHLCQELDRQVSLAGNAEFSRELLSDDSVVYTVSTVGDNIFRLPSVASAHIKVLEVVEVQKVGCPLANLAFATKTERGPSRRWNFTQTYHAGNPNETTWNGAGVSVDAPKPDDVYCDNKFRIISTTGDTDHKLIAWTQKNMTMEIRVKGKGLLHGSPGTHIEAILYVKFVPPDELNDPANGCTALPPPLPNNAYFMMQGANAHGITELPAPDGFKKWVYIP